MPGVSRQTAAHQEDHGPVLDSHEALGDLAEGDAFYVPAGHTAEVIGGTEYVQFSPADELHKISAVMERNAKAVIQQA
jgi:hypothetical protein